MREIRIWGEKRFDAPWSDKLCLNHTFPRYASGASQSSPQRPPGAGTASALFGTVYYGFDPRAQELLRGYASVDQHC